MVVWASRVTKNIQKLNSESQVEQQSTLKNIQKFVLFVRKAKTFGIYSSWNIVKKSSPNSLPVIMMRSVFRFHFTCHREIFTKERFANVISLYSWLLLKSTRVHGVRVFAE